MEPLLTKAEAAKILKVSERQIDRLREAGELACVKIGVGVRFTGAELARYVEANTEGKGSHSDTGRK